MATLRVGIQLASLNLPFQQALLTAGRLGAQSVEIDARGEFKPGEVSATALRQVRKMLTDANLRVGSVRFSTRRTYYDLDQLDRRVEATKAAMRLAYDLRAPIVVNSFGRVPDESAGPEWGVLVQVLSDLGNYGTRVGARLAGRTGTENGESLARLIAAMPEGSVGVDFDPAGLIENGFRVEDAVAALGRDVAQVRARDAVRDRGQGRSVEVPLGRGSADFPAIFGALEDHAFRGNVVIERNGAADPVAEVAAAVSYLREL